MNGKFAAGSIVISAAVAGIAIYYLQVYAFYEPVTFTPGSEITLIPLGSGQPEPIVTEGVTGIDADSSPLRFRACFTTPLSHAMLSETYVAYPGAEPLVAPGWFDCFDAVEIGTALERGEALAFLSQASVATNVDRVVAVFPDGRAFAWHQLNPAAKD
jgi:hypothetical protein